MSYAEAERELAVIGGRQAPAAIADKLPAANYPENFQPSYEDVGALVARLHELHAITPVTSFSQVDALGSRLARIAEGSKDSPILILGGCNEEVPANMPIDQLAEQSMGTLDIVSSSALGHALTILRGRGQNSKPRSAEAEELPDGTKVPSYMGDAVNSRDVHGRTADPGRMVAAAVQARNLETRMTLAAGRHVPAAHEALLLPYEQSFVRQDPVTGEDYLLSADLPWIGKRTNSADGAHVNLLAGVVNPVGVKIGPDSTPEHVMALTERLNPDNQPGKLVLMFRLGIDNIYRLPPLLKAIKAGAPGTLLIGDIHGADRPGPDGKKTRLVSDIIKENQAIALLCQDAGLKLHGLHLETMADNDARPQCVDSLDQKPAPGNLDPQLNPRQTKRVLDAVAPYLTSSLA